MNNDKQRRRNERGQRVDVYMDAQAEDFPANLKGGILAARLKELLAQVAALDVEREANARKRKQGTEGRQETRTALRRMLKSVWDTSKTIARDHPDTKGMFESPGKIKNDESLVAAARAAADSVATLANIFTSFGLPSNFSISLRSRADTLAGHIAAQNAGVNASVDANAAIENALQEMDDLVESLNTVVTNKYPEGHPKLIAWKSARRIESAPRSKAGGDNEQPPPTHNN